MNPTVTMRYLPLLAFLLTAGLATAQPPPDTPTTPALTRDQEAALFGLPVLATAGVTALLVRADVPAIALGLPLVPAAAVCATGAVAGLGGDCLHTFQNTLLWSLPGYALIGLGFGEGTWDGLGLVALGGLYLLVASPIAAIESYRLSAVRAAPAVLSDPATHRFAPGVQIRFGL